MHLIETHLSATGFMPTVDNIVYQDLLALNDGDGERHENSSVENLI